MAASSCSVLAWLAAVVTLNEKRTGPRYDAAAISKETVSDGMHPQHTPTLLLQGPLWHRPLAGSMFWG